MSAGLIGAIIGGSCSVLAAIAGAFTVYFLNRPANQGGQPSIEEPQQLPNPPETNPVRRPAASPPAPYSDDPTNQPTQPPIVTVPKKKRVVLTLTARKLSINQGDDFNHWRWNRDISFDEIATLVSTRKLEIKGSVDLKEVEVPRGKTCVACLVYRLPANSRGFSSQSLDAYVKDEEGSCLSAKTVCLAFQASAGVDELPRHRPYGWTEVVLGEFRMEGDGKVVVGLEGGDTGEKKGLVVACIELTTEE